MDLDPFKPKNNNSVSISTVHDVDSRGCFHRNVTHTMWSCWVLSSILAELLPLLEQWLGLNENVRPWLTAKQKTTLSSITLLCKLDSWHILKFLLKIPYYAPSLCYQYQPPASPGHYYSEEEQREMSPLLEVSDGEDEFEDHSSYRKDTSEYIQWELGLISSSIGNCTKLIHILIV